MSDFVTLEENTRRSFSAVKGDILQMREELREQREMIAKLNENQKTLLLRLRDAKKKLIEKKNEVVFTTGAIMQPAQKKEEVVKEVKIIHNSNMTVPKPEYVGAKTSMKLHNPMCPYAKNIKPKNKVVFRSKVKPKNLGYKLCDCLKKV